MHFPLPGADDRQTAAGYFKVVLRTANNTEARMAMTPAHRSMALRLLKPLRASGSDALLGGSMALAEHGMTPRRPRSLDLFLPPENEVLPRAVRVLQQAYRPPKYRWEAIGAVPNCFSLALYDNLGQRFAVNLVEAGELGAAVEHGYFGPIMSPAECARRLTVSLIDSEQWRVRAYIDIAHTYLHTALADTEMLSVLRGDRFNAEDRASYREALRSVADLPDQNFKRIIFDFDPAQIRAVLAALADQVDTDYASSDGRNTLLHKEVNSLTKAELETAYNRLRNAGAYAWESSERLRILGAQSAGQASLIAKEVPEAQKRAQLADVAVAKADLDSDPAVQEAVRMLPNVSLRLLREQIQSSRQVVARDALNSAETLTQEVRAHVAILSAVNRELERRSKLSGRERAAEAAVRTGRNDAIGRYSGGAPHDQVVDLASRRLSGARIPSVSPGSGADGENQQARARRSL